MMPAAASRLKVTYGALVEWIDRMVVYGGFSDREVSESGARPNKCKEHK